MSLPTDAKARKDVPIMTGVLDYFPDAIAAVAVLSKIGNDQHNPGEPMHWARGKSGDEADAAVRHLMERGAVDTDGVRHSTKAAWRALANLQKELETQEGCPLSRASIPAGLGAQTESDPENDQARTYTTLDELFEHLEREVFMRDMHEDRFR